MCSMHVQFLVGVNFVYFFPFNDLHGGWWNLEPKWTPMPKYFTHFVLKIFFFEKCLNLAIIF